jgi:hypothetical protein
MQWREQTQLLAQFCLRHSATEPSGRRSTDPAYFRQRLERWSRSLVKRESHQAGKKQDEPGHRHCEECGRSEFFAHGNHLSRAYSTERPGKCSGNEAEQGRCSRPTQPLLRNHRGSAGRDHERLDAHAVFPAAATVDLIKDASCIPTCLCNSKPCSANPLCLLRAAIVGELKPVSAFDWINARDQVDKLGEKARYSAPPPR